MGDLYGVRGPTDWGMRVAAAKVAALLSLLFLVVYGSTNWITSQRTDVGTWSFAWELAIPFVPLMIVPYLSLDVFFVAAPFLCREPRELQTLWTRITFAIVAAGIGFLLLPLRVVFEKPEVDGWLGVLFGAFLGLDKPYNLLPSLHITLRTILADLYARHTQGLMRGAVYLWFSLIGFATVLTYQHHVVDVVGGFVLATFCFYLLRESAPALPGTRNLRIASYHGLGAGGMLVLAWATWPWGGLWLWPTLGMGIATAAYAWLGPGIYRKSAGRLPLSTQLVLGPLLLCQHLSLLYYRRQCRRWDQVTPGLLIGRQLSDADAADAVRHGVTAVLDLTAEFGEAAPFRAMTYRNLPILDLTAPTLDQMREAVQFIGAEAARGTVYVHCKAGYSRSAAVVVAYLLSSHQAATTQEAVEQLRKARPSIIIRPEVLDALRAFERIEVGRKTYAQTGVSSGAARPAQPR